MTALLAYTAFAIGVASPGPSVLAIMGTAMAQGRAQSARRERRAGSEGAE